jgi:tetratricopeptide (TPR) repeat protein
MPKDRKKSKPLERPGHAGGGVNTEAMVSLNRGIEAATSGRSDEAIGWFRKSLEVQPGLAAAHANLGLALVGIRRYVEAESHLRLALAQMPDVHLLREALAETLLGQGRFQEAEQAYRLVLAARPDLAQAHANRGFALNQLRRTAEAVESYHRALLLEPGMAVAHYSLGTILKQQGRMTDAIHHFREALTHRPDYPQALNNLGNCLRKSGLIEEAREALERALSLQPGLLEAHYNLAVLKTYRFDDPQVEAVMALAERLPTMSERDRIRYWFTRGKMLEDTQRYDEAFPAYAEGNRLVQSRLAWDETADMAMHAFCLNRFTPEFFSRHPSANTADSPIPIFIVGMPRSGTSLIEQILATSQGVFGAGELTFLGETLKATAADRPDSGFSIAETLQHASTEDLLRLGRSYLARIRKLAPDATHITDKLPGNFMHVGLIHLMLPNAKIIHAMRDPMDCCFSCFSRHFKDENLGFTYDLGSLGRYWVRYSRLMDHWRAVLPAGRVLDISYEAMVADVEGEARRMLDYLGLPWDSRCLAFHENRRPVRTASAAQVQRPVYQTSVARWKHFEGHLGALMDIIGGR